jgi:prolyl-tRNA editing enzyme YbaK/EbsC (Cys-tRNA(Pro) deacylase)
MMKPATAASALVVQAILGERFRVLEFDASTRTAADAAAAIGCTVDRIAKSLVFKTQTTARSVLVVIAGPDRVDEIRVAEAISETIVKADAAFVRAKTGFAIGGVPPVGHATEPLVLIDDGLLCKSTIWVAAGTPNAVFELTPADLVSLTGGRIAALRCVDA